MLTVLASVAFLLFAALRWSFTEDALSGRNQVLPPQPVETIEDGATVKLEGVVRLVPSPPPLHTPITRRPCAAYGIVIERLKGIHWEVVYEAYRSTTFMLEQGDDGALVRAEEATPHLRPDAMGGATGQDAAPERLGAFCRRVGVSTIDVRGKQKLMRFQEATLGEGDMVRVVGVAKWERPLDGGATYRDRPRRLVIHPPEEGTLRVVATTPFA